MINKINEQGVTSEIIQELITDHADKAQRMRGLYERYLGNKLPIDEREFKDLTKINNKISNDYRGEIVEGATGYVYGRPISYQVNEEPYGEILGAKLNDTLDRWEDLNNLPDLDNETGKMAIICGYASRLLYVDLGTGEERAVNIKPWETTYVLDESDDEVTYAMRYYEVIRDKRPTVRVEWYDDKNVTYYIKQEGTFILDPLEDAQEHLFDYVPLIKFSNNDEEMGDFEKVEPLINAYDRLVSDGQNELEEFRQAYMKFTGEAAPDKETILAARQTGAFHVPGGDVGFITKQINDVFLENQKKTLNDNIYKFSSTVDMADENFSGGAQSGESRKWKLLALENKAINKERKFTRGLRQQFKVLTSAWQKKGIQVDYLDLSYTFTRNMPIDMAYYATIIKDLRGSISDMTLYENIPFIDDALQEISRMDAELEAYRDSLGEVDFYGETEEEFTEED